MIQYCTDQLDAHNFRNFLLWEQRKINRELLEKIVISLWYLYWRLYLSEAMLVFKGVYNETLLLYEQGKFHFKLITLGIHTKMNPTALTTT